MMKKEEAKMVNALSLECTAGQQKSAEAAALKFRLELMAKKAEKKENKKKVELIAKNAEKDEEANTTLNGVNQQH